MTLQEWMTANDYSVHDVAAAVDTVPHNVANWLAGNNVPNSTKMRLVIDLTKGDVTPNDFYELPARKK